MYTKLVTLEKFYTSLRKNPRFYEIKISLGVMYYTRRMI